MKKTLILAMALVMVATSIASAQGRRQGNPRPPWQDVCCGGPCCSKPLRPGR